MKENGSLLRKVQLVLLLFMISYIINGQTFTLTIRNAVQISDRTLRFDIYLLNTNAAVPIELAGVQAGILVNPAIYNSGTLSASIVPGSSRLNGHQAPSSVIWTQSQNIIKLTSETPPGSGRGTIIGTVTPGTRVCTIQLTDNVPFGTARPDLTFNFSTLPYPTKVSAYVSGVNTFLTCNNLNCFSLASNKILNPTPVITGANTVCAGTPGNKYITQSGMTNYVWSISPSGTITAGGTRSDSTVTVNWNSVGAQTVSVTFDQTTTGPVTYPVSVISCAVSGYVRYNNPTLDPLAGITITIDGKSSTTDLNGLFTVTGVPSGTWEITANANNKKPAGINSTDAGLINYWFTHPAAIDNVRILAGDVNLDNGINAADAQWIQRYFVLGQPFTRAPWVIWNASGTGINYPPAPTVTVNNASVSNFEIRALCTGDFNESDSPNITAKGLESNVEMVTTDQRQVNINSEFELPVRATSKMKIGALSLILNIPGDLIKVSDIRICGSSEPLDYSVDGDMVRIGWYSLNPVKVNPDEALVILKLKAVKGLAAGKSFELKLEDNPLNEIAGEDFQVMQHVVLKSEIIEASIKGDDKKSLSLSAYPNPVSEESIISYTLPSDGKVVISISNLSGKKIQTVADLDQIAGKYSLKLDASALADGVYILSLNLNHAGNDTFRTIKIIVRR